MKLKNMIECLQIADKYCDSLSYCCAEHDILYLPLDKNVVLDPADKARLEKLGAFISDVDSWAVYT